MISPPKRLWEPFHTRAEYVLNQEYKPADAPIGQQVLNPHGIRRKCITESNEPLARLQ